MNIEYAPCGDEPITSEDIETFINGLGFNRGVGAIYLTNKHYKIFVDDTLNKNPSNTTRIRMSLTPKDRKPPMREAFPRFLNIMLDIYPIGSKLFVGHIDIGNMRAYKDTFQSKDFLMSNEAMTKEDILQHIEISIRFFIADDFTFNVAKNGEPNPYFIN